MGTGMGTGTGMGMGTGMSTSQYVDQLPKKYDFSGHDLYPGIVLGIGLCPLPCSAGACCRVACCAAAALERAVCVRVCVRVCMFVEDIYVLCN